MSAPCYWNKSDYFLFLGGRVMYAHAGTNSIYPLYDARWEHDACGIGFVAHVSGEASHSLVQTALQALAHLTHRGAQDADAQTGDGAGLLTQIPTSLLAEELLHTTTAHPDDLAVGMIFLPSQERSPTAYGLARQLIEQTVQEAGFSFFTWRNPPIDYTVLGSRARATAPTIAQILLTRPPQLTTEQYDRLLYRTQRLIERHLQQAHIEDCYLASFSRTTIVYKGLMAPNELPHFYLDLANPRYTTAFAIFHQRYSTNTFPSWPLAQPMRLLAHNGEINTRLGNCNWMQARESSLFSPQWGSQLQDLSPVIQPGGSDSAELDNALQMLTHTGRDLLHSMQMLIPPAWEHNAELPAEQRAWCEYHAGLTEPWDGPAALVFSNGDMVGAALDRNGLRPARYTLTSSGLLIVASEAGVIPFPAHEIVEKGRLGPGEMIAVDLKQGILLRNSDIKAALAQRQPYQQWLEQYLLRLSDLPQPVASLAPSNGTDHHANLFSLQQLFGYTHEEREVMSLDCYLGRRQNFLVETPLHAQLLHLTTPLLTEPQLETLRGLKSHGFHSCTLDVTFDIADGPAALEAALQRLEDEAVTAVASGTTLLILSDRGADSSQAPLPMLLAIGAVHQTLIRRGMRTYTSLICETGAAWDTHQIALLLGYGAEAVTPYLALASVRALSGERHLEDLTPDEAVTRYLHVIGEGLRKIMARMGISTIRNIIGGGQFEIVGLDRRLIERCFAHSAAHPGNVTYTHFADQIIARCQTLEQSESRPEPANGRRRKLLDMGRYRFRRDAEYHAFNPLIIRALQKAALTGQPDDYLKFTDLVYQRPPTTLRDLLTFVPTTP